MKKFIESVQCKSEFHCRLCRGSEKFRANIHNNFEWDGECPLGKELTEFVEPKNGLPTIKFPQVRTISSKSAMNTSNTTRKGGCKTKHCRLGNIECESYWGCRDTCRVENKRITSMEKCPN